MKDTLARIMAKKIPDEKSYWKNTYMPTDQKVALTYNTLNKVLFKGRLERPYIRLYQQQNVWGWADLLDNYKTTMGLNHRYPCEQFFVAVLGHEMVHQWQWEIDSPRRRKEGLRIQTSHGENFMEWKETFEKHDIPFGIVIPDYYKAKKKKKK